MRPILLLLATLLPLPLTAQPLTPLPHSAQADGYAVLIVSRERLEVPTTCEVALYLQDQLAARLFQGQSVAFNLPPGSLSLRLGLIGGGHCQDGIVQPGGRVLHVHPGEVKRYRIALGPAGLQLRDAPALH